MFHMEKRSRNTLIIITIIIIIEMIELKTGPLTATLLDQC